jgi:GR25 family glycosyltransferase involved in LPS biosynthesis
MAFPPILVINLDDRKDRWTDIQQAFRHWPMPLERVSAVRMKPGWKGCSLSHKKCIEIAKERNYPWVLILEDDCLPEEHSLQRFQNLLPTLWKRKMNWDIFNGGPSQIFEAKIVSETPPLLQIKGYATHFILVHEGFYDKLIEDVNENMKIDVHYKDNVRSWSSVPLLATQAISQSDIENTQTDYSENFKKVNIYMLDTLQSYSSKLDSWVATGLIGAAVIGLVYSIKK